MIVVAESPRTFEVAASDSAPDVPVPLTVGAAVEVEVSTRCTTMLVCATAAAAAGRADTYEVTDTESEVPSLVKLIVISAAVLESDVPVVAVPFATVTVVALRLITAAFDGATERTPRPKAATATSAMRLNVVFVDICFLSIVELRTIRGSALELVS